MRSEIVRASQRSTIGRTKQRAQKSSRSPRTNPQKLVRQYGMDAHGWPIQSDPRVFWTELDDLERAAAPGELVQTRHVRKDAPRARARVTGETDSDAQDALLNPLADVVADVLDGGAAEAQTVARAVVREGESDRYPLAGGERGNRRPDRRVEDGLVARAEATQLERAKRSTEDRAPHLGRIGNPFARRGERYDGLFRSRHVGKDSSRRVNR